MLFVGVLERLGRDRSERPGEPAAHRGNALAQDERRPTGRAGSSSRRCSWTRRAPGPRSCWGTCLPRSRPCRGLPDVPVTRTDLFSVPLPGLPPTRRRWRSSPPRPGGLMVRRRRRLRPTRPPGFHTARAATTGAEASTLPWGPCRSRRARSPPPALAAPASAARPAFRASGGAVVPLPGTGVPPSPEPRHAPPPVQSGSRSPTSGMGAPAVPRAGPHHPLPPLAAVPTPTHHEAAPTAGPDAAARRAHARGAAASGGGTATTPAPTRCRASKVEAQG